jgi:hypothetical protein
MQFNDVQVVWSAIRVNESLFEDACLGVETKGFRDAVGISCCLAKFLDLCFHGFLLVAHD